MRKTVAIILSALMMLYSIGFYFIYQYDVRSLKQANHSIAAALKSTPDIIVITASVKDGKITRNDIRLSDDNEISYKGHLYDIVSTRHSKGQIEYSCIADEKEENINTIVNNQVEKQSDHAGKKGLAVSKTLSLFFEEEHVGLKAFYTIVPCKNAIAVVSCLPAPYHNIPSPPPWA